MFIIRLGLWGDYPLRPNKIGLGCDPNSRNGSVEVSKYVDTVMIPLFLLDLDLDSI